MKLWVLVIQSLYLGMSLSILLGLFILQLTSELPQKTGFMIKVANRLCPIGIILFLIGFLDPSRELFGYTSRGLRIFCASSYTWTMFVIATIWTGSWIQNVIATRKEFQIDLSRKVKWCFILVSNALYMIFYIPYNLFYGIKWTKEKSVLGKSFYLSFCFFVSFWCLFCMIMTLILVKVMLKRMILSGTPRERVHSTVASSSSAAAVSPSQPSVKSDHLILMVKAKLIFIGCSCGAGYFGFLFIMGILNIVELEEENQSWLYIVATHISIFIYALLLYVVKVSWANPSRNPSKSAHAKTSQRRTSAGDALTTAVNPFKIQIEQTINE
jgi:hypothetical protein